ncbi:VRR-NUC domain-containing protein [Enterovibrio sp. ZSDZ42]|uniref:phosphodiesterase I n=1 Tax=Enterovibrio gelatinilyticus TaxID=2899819 RepID=A0ABT5R2W8_9GAMM|nr:VRR-NUC domain-containing protein [Enterovibrio sp. ZSDZ42]MDD1794616.1 VRR-NUC domain-containing protein [Enterovibrio sp. ZSDZ42]
MKRENLVIHQDNSEKRPTEVLPERYYLDNFLSIVDIVTHRYEDLLTNTEKEWLASFSALATNAKLLTVRLLSRKGNWFRRDKLHYDEISDIDEAIQELVEQNMISVTRTPPVLVAVDLMTKPELIKHFSSIAEHASNALKPSAKKADLIDEIVVLLEGKEIPPMTSDCLCISHDVLPVFLLLYFGNSRQDLSQFVLSDLGIYRFERVSLLYRDRLFNSRDQVQDWLIFSTLSDDLFKLTENKEVKSSLSMLNALPPKPSWSPLSRKWDRLANQLARDAERVDDLKTAATLFAQSNLPPARERLARIALKQSDLNGACNWIEAMLRSPITEDEKEVAQRLARQIVKKAPKTSVLLPPLLSENTAVPPQEFATNMASMDIDQRVERVAALAFEAQGWNVWFCENAVLNAVFGLLLWDIIFAPIKGAFMHPFQRSPRDMYSPEFGLNRHSLIESRFLELQQGHYSLLKVYDEKIGITNDWVQWHLVDRSLVEAICSTFTTTQIIRCVERILFDPKSNRAGHPDLFMVKEKQCQFVEIKGPGDKLQHHQVRWLNFLNQQQIESSVLYVNSSSYRANTAT